MPPKGGVRQRLKFGRDEREGIIEIRRTLESDDEEVVDKNDVRTFRAGGRAKAATALSFLAGMFVTGRISAIEAEEGASASASAPSSSANSSGNLGVGRGGGDPSLAGASSQKTAYRNVMQKLGRTSAMRNLYCTYITVWCNKTNRKVRDLFTFCCFTKCSTTPSYRQTYLIGSAKYPVLSLARSRSGTEEWVTMGTR